MLESYLLSLVACIYTYADDPGLEALLALNVLAVGGGLLARQRNEKTARRLGACALQEAELAVAVAVAAAGRFAHRRHLGYDGQIVNDKVDLVALMARQILRVAKQTKARDVRGRVGIVPFFVTTNSKGM